MIRLRWPYQRPPLLKLQQLPQLIAEAKKEIARVINSKRPNAKFRTQIRAIGTKDAIEIEIIGIGIEIVLATTMDQPHQVGTEKEIETGTIEKEDIAVLTLSSKGDIIRHQRVRQSITETPKGPYHASTQRMKSGEVGQDSALRIDAEVETKVAHELVAKTEIIKAKTR